MPFIFKLRFGIFVWFFVYCCHFYVTSNNNITNLANKKIILAIILSIYYINIPFKIMANSSFICLLFILLFNGMFLISSLTSLIVWAVKTITNTYIVYITLAPWDATLLQILLNGILYAPNCFCFFSWWYIMHQEM